ncbi:MAG: phytanoyl-CoA dioxygenase family protein [Alphaproteobacteria bacterium]|nr:phytanoyl-CoA dioxygenase family protein [Alphaproteobacteria bacterium]
MTAQQHRDLVFPAEALGGAAAEAAYRRAGAVVFENVLTPDALAALQRETDRLQTEAGGRPDAAIRLARRPTVDAQTIFERIDPVCDLSPPLAALAADPRLLAFAGRLIGGQPFLFKDKINYKLPRDRGYLLHQDLPHLDGCEGMGAEMTVAVLCIDPLTDENGGLTMYLGYHDDQLPAPPGNPRDVDPSAVDPARAWPIRTGAGSLLFFHILTPHESGPNLSDRPRRLLFLDYTRVENAWTREVYYRARRRRIETEGVAY